MIIKIPEQVQCIISHLNEYGYEAYVVGGCVRDSLMGREPVDWDITTDARPEQVKELFRRTIDTGIRHGTVTVMVEKTGYEVTTYRIDGEYEDGRHPKSVEFTGSLIEDLKRRDFTINAMAYSGRDGLVDEFGGVRDLEGGLIRCVGNPEDRFTEDTLRILRAVRFSALLGFQIHEDTRQAIVKIAPHLVRTSKERIAVELTKLLLSDHTDRMALVYTLGIAPFISKLFANVAWQDGQQGGLAQLLKLRPEKYLRWAGFLKNETEAHAAGILKDLKMDHDTIQKVKTLVMMWKEPMDAAQPAIRRTMSRIDPLLYEDLLDFQEVFSEEEGVCQVQLIRERAESIRAAGDCVDLKQLAVTGRELIAAGMKPGPELGETLAKMFDFVLEHPEYNKKEELLSLFLEEKDRP